MEKVVTEHGEVEYKTKECTSCGNKVVEEEAYVAIIGDVKNRRYRSGQGEYEFTLNSDYYKAPLCPYCAESENINLDLSDSMMSILVFLTGMLLLVALLILFVLLA
jgi:hypothetical protein